MSNNLFILSILSFIFGALSMFVIGTSLDSPSVEVPYFSQDVIERASPSDTIKEEHIRVYKNGVYVDIKNGEDEWLVQLDLQDATWSTFLDTNSMDPLFDVGANTIRIEVSCPTELSVGDIVTYKHDQYGLVIHRIVVKDVDELGPYFVLKGDNNPVSDPGKVRCEQIQGKVVGILY